MNPAIFFKCSDNQKSYRDLVPQFLAQGVYEVDAVPNKNEAKRGQGESSNRKGQIDAVHKYLNDGTRVIMYIKDKKNFLYKGVMESKFEKNTTSPFYLKPEVVAKAKDKTDISHHPFYTCKVNWNREPLTPEDTAIYKKTLEKKSRFLGKTLVVLD